MMAQEYESCAHRLEGVVRAAEDDVGATWETFKSEQTHEQKASSQRRLISAVAVRET